MRTAAAAVKFNDARDITRLTEILAIASDHHPSPLR